MPEIKTTPPDLELIARVTQQPLERVQAAYDATLAAIRERWPARAEEEVERLNTATNWVVDGGGGWDGGRWLEWDRVLLRRPGDKDE